MTDAWPQQVFTQQILDVAGRVSQELGWGFTEPIYIRAMAMALAQDGLSVSSEVPLAVSFRGETIGTFTADLMVEESILVGVQTTGQVLPEDEAKVLSQLKATGVRVGLLLDFGSPTVIWRRMYA